MTIYTPEKLEEDLQNVSSTLQVVHSLVKSDSIRMQEMNKLELARGSSLLKSIIYGVKPERQVQLTVGETAIMGRDFNYRSRANYISSPKSLEPGDTLILEKTDEYWNTSLRTSELQTYVGGLLLMVNLDLVGETLRDGGELSVVDIIGVKNQDSELRL